MKQNQIAGLNFSGEAYLSLFKKKERKFPVQYRHHEQKATDPTKIVGNLTNIITSLSIFKRLIYRRTILF